MHRRAARYAWLKRLSQAGAVVFVAWTAWSIAERWDGLPRDLKLAWVVAAGASLVASNVLAAFVWRGILEGLAGERGLPRLWLVQVHSSSQLARYTPGKIGLPALRVGALGPKGVAPALVLTSTLLEVISWALTSAGVSALVLSLASPKWLERFLQERFGLSASVASAAFGAVALLCVAASRVSWSRLPSGLREKLQVSGSGAVVPGGVLALHALFWGLWLLHGWLLLGALGRPDWGSATGFIVAPVVGFIALLAPAGAGVREAVVIAALAPVVGWSHATAAGLLSRALSLLADVGVWATVSVLARWQSAT